LPSFNLLHFPNCGRWMHKASPSCRFRGCKLAASLVELYYSAFNTRPIDASLTAISPILLSLLHYFNDEF
jgi:hypothetical protein